MDEGGRETHHGRAEATHRRARLLLLLLLLLLLRRAAPTRDWAGSLYRRARAVALPVLEAAAPDAVRHPWAPRWQPEVGKAELAR
jgi:hypothetical protein